MYTIGGDESADESQSRVFAVGSVVGSNDEWAALKAAWLDRTGGRIFHAADCDSDQGDYANTPHRDNKALYRDLTQLVARSKLFGFGTAISLMRFDELFPTAIKGQPYIWCFSKVLIKSLQTVTACIPQGEIEILFDSRFETQHNAGLLYDSVASRPEWRDVLYLPNRVSFSSRRIVEIQVADLVARETMKHLDNRIGPVQRDTRRSWRALMESGRFGFEFAGDGFLESMRDWLLSNGIPKHGHIWDGYRAWLQEKGITDSGSARLRYAAFLDAEEIR